MKVAWLLFLFLFSGCFISSREITKYDPKSVSSDFYCVYTNGEFNVNGNYTNKVTKYCITSYLGGPWKGSFIYPGTRFDLNILSGWSYSSAASGNYMNNLVTIPTYPLYIVALPIELVIDTVLLPFDLWNKPNPGEGWNLMGVY